MLQVRIKAYLVMYKVYEPFSEPILQYFVLIIIFIVQGIARSQDM